MKSTVQNVTKSRNKEGYSATNSRGLFPKMRLKLREKLAEISKLLTKSKKLG